LSYSHLSFFSLYSLAVSSIFLLISSLFLSFYPFVTKFLYRFMRTCTSLYNSYTCSSYLATSFLSDRVISS
jgi:hypothetical protein